MKYYKIQNGYKTQCKELCQCVDVMCVCVGGGGGGGRGGDFRVKMLNKNHIF